jgi:hypothetical protein
VLYQRYKKHLPATQRCDVDQLVDLLARGGEPGELERAVEHILSTVWSSGGTPNAWDAAILGNRPDDQRGAAEASPAQYTPGAIVRCMIMSAASITGGAAIFATVRRIALQARINAFHLANGGC